MSTEKRQKQTQVGVYYVLMVGLDPFYSQLSPLSTFPVVTPANILSLSFSGGLCNATLCSYFAESPLHGARRVGDSRFQSRVGNSIHFFNALKLCYLPSYNVVGLVAELLSASCRKSRKTPRQSQRLYRRAEES